VRAVTAEPQPALVVYSKASPHPPPQAVGVARYCLNDRCHLYASELTKLLGHESGFQLPLGPEVYVLPVAAATVPRTGMRARDRHSISRGVEDFHRVGPQVMRPMFSDPRPYPLPWKGVAHKDHPPVWCLGGTAAPHGHLPHFELNVKWHLYRGKG
jgi:hypothetical protein